jgi:hypothetical protein
MAAGMKANPDGSAAIQVGGTDYITISSAGATTFLASPTIAQAGTASTPSITFTGDTNTGIYSPGADRIGFAEDGTQVGEFDSSGNFLFNSGYGSVATAYGCRAWVNFNGTTNVGGFCTISASGNVSTVADNGTGDYTITFATAMPDANYSVVTATGSVTTANVQCVFNIAQTTQNGGPTLKSTTQLRVVTGNGSSGTKFDNAECNVAIFR